MGPLGPTLRHNARFGGLFCVRDAMKAMPNPLSKSLKNHYIL